MKRFLLFLPVLLVALTMQDDELTPPDWATMDEVAKKGWQTSVDNSVAELKKEHDARLKAAIQALKRTMAAGATAEDSKKTMVDALDAGYDPDDYDQLGAFVVGRRKAGLRGTELAGEIHTFVKDRHVQRFRARHPDRDGGDPPGGEKDRPGSRRGHGGKPR
jgi:hypothetical protein